MKAQLMMNGRKWSLYGGVLAATVYAALTLTSQPAYAGACTLQQCAADDTNICVPLCSGVHGHVRSFQCNNPPGDFTCICADGLELRAPC
jgi:hypothetical protein